MKKYRVILAYHLRSTGTLGLWEALRVLGYQPFHITELLPHDIQKIQALQEAMVASKSDKPFGLNEFSRIWGNYDVSKNLQSQIQTSDKLVGPH